jgi:hypothetical protein
MSYRSSFTFISALALAMILVAWSPTSSASLRCCYSGDVVDTQATSIEVKRKDANDYVFIEEPDVNVLFMEEIARGLDHPVAQLGGEHRLRAVVVPAGDIDGLIRLVYHHRTELNADARKTFDEIDLPPIESRLDGTEPGEREGARF